MSGLLRVVSFLLIICAPVLPQTDTASAFIDGVLSNAELGFRFRPPSNMVDETATARESIRSRAAELHTSNVFDALLSLRFGQDDTASDWYAVSIETFPRFRLSAQDDLAAEARMNVLAAGARASLVGTPQQVTFSGHRFVVSEFEQEEAPLTKHARVYTTIRGDKFLTFAFTANSAGNVPPIADSMQTLEFTGHSTSHLGFDRNDYPGDDSLAELRKTFSYTGYWLNNPPGAKANTWLGKRARIENANFGFLVLFNGRLFAELKTVAAATKLGQSDAQAAIAAARREGFPDATIIFLDQEQGGRMLPEQKAYLLAWIDGVSQMGFRAGVYCSGMAAKEEGGNSVITADDIRQSAGSRKITYWVTNDGCPPAPGCVVPQHPPSPAQSGIAFAEVWQFAQSPKRKDVAGACAGYSSDGNCYPPAPNGQHLHVDLNIATSPDPSHGKVNR